MSSVDKVDKVLIFVRNFHVFSGDLEVLSCANLRFPLTVGVSTDVSQKVASDGVLNGIGVLTVGNEPWNVSVSWLESLCLKSLFVLKSVTGFTLHASHDGLTCGGGIGTGVGNLLVVGASS